VSDLSDFEIKIYELNFERNEHGHELRWKFMYAYVGGALAFWGFIFSRPDRQLVPRGGYFLPLLFALFGAWSYYALRQNMRVRGRVMRELEAEAGVKGWQTLRSETPKKEWQKPMVATAYAFWGTMIVISTWLGCYMAWRG
jgi:hypothetical protein